MWHPMNKVPTTILIIEDEEILRQSVVDYLEDRDAEVDLNLVMTGAME